MVSIAICSHQFFSGPLCLEVKEVVQLVTPKLAMHTQTGPILLREEDPQPAQIAIPSTFRVMV